MTEFYSIAIKTISNEFSESLGLVVPESLAMKTIFVSLGLVVGRSV